MATETILTREGDRFPRPKPRSSAVNILDINTLPQPRKTFRGIDDLAESIAKYGLLHPLMVADLDSNHLANYLEYVEKIWGDKYKLKDPHPTQGGRYLILIAGESRLRAALYLLETGCISCRQDSVNLDGITCYNRHFADTPNQIDARIYFNIHPREALTIQEEENRHNPVPPNEQANSLSRLYKVRKEEYASRGEKLTLEEFARNVGRPADTIREYFRYIALPDGVQDLYERGLLSYGKAVEIQRLIDNIPNFTPNDIQIWTDKACLGPEDLKEFRRIVSAHINAHHSTQPALFTLDPSQDTRRALVRKVVAPRLKYALDAERHYRERATELLGDKELRQAISLPGTRLTVERSIQNLREQVTAMQEVGLITNGHISKVQQIIDIGNSVLEDPI